jgi:hypothetical protein
MVFNPRRRRAMEGVPYRAPGAGLSITSRVASPSGVPTVQPSQGPAARGFADYLGQARSLYNPALQASAEAINRRTEFGMGAIGQYTGQLVGMAGQYAGQVRQAYQPQIDLGRGVANWAQSALVGAGKAGQGDLNAALAQSGFAPSAGPRDINLKQQGKGAGGAAYGTGMADVDALVAAQAASAARAAQEPTWAAGLGEQAKTLLAVQSARALADQQAALEAQIPGLALDLRSQDISQAQDLRDYQLRLREFQAQQAAARTQQAQTRAQITGPNAPTLAGRQAYWDKVAADRTTATGTLYKGTTTGIAPVLDPRTKRPVLTSGERQTRLDAIIGTYYTKQGLSPEGVRQAAAIGYNLGTGTSATGAAAQQRLTQQGQQYQQKLAQDWRKEQLRFTQTQQRLQIQRQNAQTSARKADIAAAAQQNLAQHRRWQEQHPHATSAKIPTSAASNLVDKWYTGKQTTQLKQQLDAQGRPLLDSHGAPIYKKVPTGAGGQLNYQQGLQRLRTMGYSDQESTQLLNTKWLRGERGRPWLNATERAKLKSGNALPHARYHKGHAYLDRGQYNLLQLDNLLPQGEWVGNRYFIKPAYN